jgi:hypothetical protein
VYFSEFCVVGQLRAGLYTFKVSVTSEGRWGEDYVNVTVLPRKFSGVSV